MIYRKGSQRRCQGGAGGNAIAMTNRAVLECQARAWGPSALLGLLLLSNHSTVNVGWISFLRPQMQLRALGLELLSVESKGTNSDQGRTGACAPVGNGSRNFLSRHVLSCLLLLRLCWFVHLGSLCWLQRSTPVWDQYLGLRMSTFLCCR